MKKTYINPQMRVVELECKNGIAELPMSGSKADGNPGLSRRSKLIDDWDEEDW